MWKRCPWPTSAPSSAKRSSKTTASRSSGSTASKPSCVDSTQRGAGPGRTVCRHDLGRGASRRAAPCSSRDSAPRIGSGTRSRSSPGEIPQRRVYTHTGWRQIDGVWVYLHGGGAIGPDGPVADVAVGLRGPAGALRPARPAHRRGARRSGQDGPDPARLASGRGRLSTARVRPGWRRCANSSVRTRRTSCPGCTDGPAPTRASSWRSAQGFYGDFTRLTPPGELHVDRQCRRALRVRGQGRAPGRRRLPPGQ